MSIAVLFYSFRSVMDFTFKGSAKKTIPIVIMLTVFLLAACEKKNEPSKPTDEQASYQASGYFLTSITTSSSGTNYFGGYFGSIPSGDIDLTQQQSFPFLFFRARHKQFIYGSPTDGSSLGLTKFGVDKKDNKLVVVGNLPTTVSPTVVEIVNDNLGFFASSTELKATSFNPETMAILNTIDLSNEIPAEIKTGKEDLGVIQMVYNSKTNKLLVVYYIDDDQTGQFYDADSTYVSVVNVASAKVEKTIKHPQAEYTLVRGERNRIIDDAGNTYLVAQGQYGLDNRIGPSSRVPKGSRPRIIKINTSSEFDTAYAWNPVDALGLQNNLIQLFVATIYAGNDKVYGMSTAKAESAEILGLIAKLAAGKATQAEFAKLRELVFNDAAQQVVEIDLKAKTAKFISGAPETAGFAYPFLYNYENTLYMQTTTQGAKFNGYHKFENGKVSEVFKITKGGFAGQLYQISDK